MFDINIFEFILNCAFDLYILYLYNCNAHLCLYIISFEDIRNLWNVSEHSQ